MASLTYTDDYGNDHEIALTAVGDGTFKLAVSAVGGASAAQMDALIALLGDLITEQQATNTLLNTIANATP